MENSRIDHLVITRKKSFFSALMPYWIIVSEQPKSVFLQRHNMEKDLGGHDALGQPVERIRMEELDEIGVRIENGKTVNIPLSENAAHLFASTMDGSLSNEIVIADLAKPEITMITKGGFRTVSYPWFVPE